jgi:outer membrane protein TolC
MNENNPEIKNQIQIDFEESIAQKNKTISRLEQERDSAISSRMKAETSIDNLKAEKQAAQERAERAEARYLRNTELETKSQAQSQSLLNTLFGGNL